MLKNMLNVHSIESFWTHEGPGIRFVVFLQWCPFRCIYCHNPDTISITGGEQMIDNKIVQMVKEVKSYFGKKWWFTVSGGEPLLQAWSLIPLFKKLHYENVHIAVDTNGNIRNDDVEKLIELTDLFLVDIKHGDPKRHKKITGKDNRNVVKFLHYLEQHNKPVRIRYVLVPWYSDQEKYIKEMGKKYGSYNCIERIEILPYHTLGKYKRKELWWEYPLEWIATPTAHQINEVRILLEKYFDKVIVR